VPRAVTDRYAAAIAGAGLKVLAGTGHALDAEVPAAFTGAVTEFLSSGQGASAR